MALTWSEVEARIERARKALEAGQYTIEPAVSASAKAAFTVRNGEDAAGDPYTVTFHEDHPTGTCTCRPRGPTLVVACAASHPMISRAALSCAAS